MKREKGQKKVKAAFYRVGDSPLATDVFLSTIGLEPVVIPPVTVATISKGILYAPEFSCFPFKVSVGILEQALESGAKLFIMPGGNSQFVCQMADFAQAQTYIMKKTGRKFEIVSIHSKNPAHIVAMFKKYNPELTLAKATNALLLVRKKLLSLDKRDDYYRYIYLSLNKRRAEEFKVMWGKKIQECNSLGGLYALDVRMQMEFLQFPKRDMSKLLRIAVIGDVYCLNESAINNNIYEKLLDMDVFVYQSIKVSELIGGGAVMKSTREIILDNESRKYLKHDIAGFAKHTIKEAIRCAEEEYDGLIHIYPFTCMPEITVRNILPKLSKDYSIPILFLPMDEQTGDAGFTTRIEAFVDLIKMRKAKHEKKDHEEHH
jgi:predicted nucleotide-binding protein (sugar kinase/HSP70/actin superfamily)